MVPAGGIFGKISEVNNDYVIVSIADGVKIRVLKTAVTPEQEDNAKK